MILFGKNKSKIPTWASFFTEKEYTAFISEIESCFRKIINSPYNINDGVVVFQEEVYGISQMGLFNLAKMCKQNKRANYAGIISDHFDILRKSYEFNQEFKKIERDFEQICKYIAVRLYDVEYLSATSRDNFISKKIAGELFAVLVFDFPDTIIHIKPTQIEQWNKSVNELFEVGIENVKKNYKLDINVVEFGPEKESLYVCETPHFFAPNIVFELRSHEELIGKGGCLVAIPNRNIALVYPINNLNVVNVVNSLCVTVPNLYDNNPGMLTKEIYWCFEGKITLLPYTIENKKICFTPPVDFIELLNSLQ